MIRRDERHKSMVQVRDKWKKKAITKYCIELLELLSVLPLEQNISKGFRAHSEGLPCA